MQYAPQIRWYLADTDWADHGRFTHCFLLISTEHGWRGFDLHPQHHYGSCSDAWQHLAYNFGQQACDHFIPSAPVARYDDHTGA